MQATAVAIAARREAHIGRHDLRRYGFERNLATQVFFDIRQRDRVFLAGEADGIAGGAGARCAADTMHVVRRILRQIVVENMANVGHMQAA